MEVSKAVSTALDEFHFSMKAFGDGIIFGESPHGGKRFTPAMESFCEGDQGFEGACKEFINDLKKGACQGADGKWMPHSNRYKLRSKCSESESASFDTGQVQ